MDRTMLRYTTISVCFWVVLCWGTGCDNDAGDSGFSKGNTDPSSTVTTDTATEDVNLTDTVGGVADTVSGDSGATVDTLNGTDGENDVEQGGDVTDVIDGDFFADVVVVTDTHDGNTSDGGDDIASPDVAATTDALPTQDTTTILGGGLEYGECLDMCKFELVLLDMATILDVYSGAAEKVASNSGTLTAQGKAQIEEAANGLLGAEIEDVYGCPGCNDGGKRYLILLLDNVQKSPAYQEDDIPPVLKNADTMIRVITEALKTCVSTAQVTVDAGCVPVE